MRKRPTVAMLAIGCWLALGGGAAAQDEASDLAKAAQNPLASLVSLPLQFNYNGGVGPYDRTLFNLNVQPVVPFPEDDSSLNSALPCHCLCPLLRQIAVPSKTHKPILNPSSPSGLPRP